MADAATEVCSSENDADTEVASEVDDVVEGSEPGASRFSMLIPTDSYDDMAKFAAANADPAASVMTQSAIDQLREAADRELADSNSEERTVADAEDSCAPNERLKPPQPIFARIDTPSSLFEDEVERQRLSAAPASSSQPDDDTLQIAVLISLIAVYWLIAAHHFITHKTQ